MLVSATEYGAPVSRTNGYVLPFTCTSTTIFPASSKYEIPSGQTAGGPESSIGGGSMMESGAPESGVFIEIGAVDPHAVRRSKRACRMSGRCVRPEFQAMRFVRF